MEEEEEEETLGVFFGTWELIAPRVGNVLGPKSVTLFHVFSFDAQNAEQNTFS